MSSLKCKYLLLSHFTLYIQIIHEYHSLNISGSYIEKSRDYSILGGFYVLPSRGDYTLIQKCKNKKGFCRSTVQVFRVTRRIYSLLEFTEFFLIYTSSIA